MDWGAAAGWAAVILTGLGGVIAITSRLSTVEGRIGSKIDDLRLESTRVQAALDTRLSIVEAAQRERFLQAKNRRHGL